MKVIMRSIIALLILVSISSVSAVSYAGYFEFMDDIAGALSRGDKQSIVHAIDTALKYKDRVGAISDNNLHDSKTRNKLIVTLIEILDSEPEGSELARKAVDALIILGRDDSKVHTFFENYLLTGQDHYIKNKISSFHNLN